MCCLHVLDSVGGGCFPRAFLPFVCAYGILLIIQRLLVSLMYRLCNIWLSMCCFHVSRKKKFFLWLALNNRCWTANRLVKRVLPHRTACPLWPNWGNNPAFDSLLRFLLDNFFLPCLNLAALAPVLGTTSFSSWWRSIWSKPRGARGDMERDLPYHSCGLWDLEASKLTCVWRIAARPCSVQENFDFRYCSIFVCIWQILSNHELTRLKRFVSYAISFCFYIYLILYICV